MNQEILLRQFEDIGIPDSAEEFTFPETAFITVTAYQNQQVQARRIWLLPYQRQFRKEIFTEAKLPYAR